MNVFLTGRAGYVGSSVAEDLVRLRQAVTD